MKSGNTNEENEVVNVINLTNDTKLGRGQTRITGHVESGTKCHQVYIDHDGKK